MKPVTLSRQLLAVCAKQRPPGYLAELRKANLSESPTDITFDSEHPAYVALLATHQMRYGRGNSAQPVAPNGSRGLGDTIARITSVFGIKPCGRCKKTQATLNRLVPYQPK
jgi:hypothetical protein